MKSDTLHLDVSTSNILWPTFVLLLLLSGVAYGFSDQNYDVLLYCSQDKFIFLKWSPLARAACLAVILLFVFIATVGDSEQPFIYQAF